jgi:hypothetical protein
MSNTPEERLDRRDFMIASITTAGASAALTITAGVANAQGAATTSADPASGTVYTGDTIQGKKVVSALDVNNLEPGKKHLLYFQGPSSAGRNPKCSVHPYPPSDGSSIVNVTAGRAKYRPLLFCVIG